jgi:hypothetical protein
MRKLTRAIARGMHARLPGGVSRGSGRWARGTMGARLGGRGVVRGVRSAVCSAVPPSQVRAMMCEHVKEQGRALVTDSERCKDPVEYVQALLNMRDKYERVITQVRRKGCCVMLSRRGPVGRGAVGRRGGCAGRADGRRVAALGSREPPVPRAGRSGGAAGAGACDSRGWLCGG